MKYMIESITKKIESQINDYENSASFKYIEFLTKGLVSEFKIDKDEVLKSLLLAQINISQYSDENAQLLLDLIIKIIKHKKTIIKKHTSLPFSDEDILSEIRRINLSFN